MCGKCTRLAPFKKTTQLTVVAAGAAGLSTILGTAAGHGKVIGYDMVVSGAAADILLAKITLAADGSNFITSHPAAKYNSLYAGGLDTKEPISIPEQGEITVNVPANGIGANVTIDLILFYEGTPAEQAKIEGVI